MSPCSINLLTSDSLIEAVFLFSAELSLVGLETVLKFLEEWWLETEMGLTIFDATGGHGQDA